MWCPNCSCECERDEIDIGVGIQGCGPWKCPNCHWEEPDLREVENTVQSVPKGWEGYVKDDD